MSLVWDIACVFLVKYATAIWIKTSNNYDSYAQKCKTKSS